MATHSRIFAWKIPWTENSGRLQSTGSQRVGHDWATSVHFKRTFMIYSLWPHGGAATVQVPEGCWGIFFKRSTLRNFLDIQHRIINHNHRSKFEILLRMSWFFTFKNVQDNEFSWIKGYSSFKNDPDTCGEGNGNPLQCSCLENPRGGGAWWAAVSGVAQSRTRLKRLSSSSSSSRYMYKLNLRCSWKLYRHKTLIELHNVRTVKWKLPSERKALHLKKDIVNNP